MNIGKLKKYLLPNLPYIMLFLFFNKVGEAYRISVEAETGAVSDLDLVAQRLMNTITNLNLTISNPIPSFNLSDMATGLAGAAIIFCIILYRKKNAKNWRKDVEYGSARWGRNYFEVGNYMDANVKRKLKKYETFFKSR